VTIARAAGIMVAPMADEYDVFLSHNGADKAAVEEIALRLLDEAGLRPFLDKWELAPGDQWIPALERGIEASKAVAVFFGRAGVGAWQPQEAQLGLIRSVQEEKRRVIPVLLPGAREASVAGFLRLRSFIDLGEDDGFAKLVVAVGGLSQELLAAFDPGPDVVRWLGVLARVQRELIDFSNERGRHTCFFGREEVLEEMDAWLLARDCGWLLVTGSPGLGKSALLDRWLRRRQATGKRTAFHFIRRGHLDWAEPQVVQRNLAAQVEVMFPEQRDPDVDPVYRLEQLLGRVSRVLVERDERLALLVDGLDEAMTAGKDNPIPYIFPLEMPERVFVVTASRPQYPHLGWFERRNGPSSRLDLDARAESNEKTVREYWSVLGKAMEPSLSDALMQAAVEGAQGNLLHAVKLHQLWATAGTERSVDTVPRGLEGILGELWRRIEELPKESRKLARQGLSLICAARESLPLRVVGKLLGWDEGDAQADFLPLVREMLLEEPWHETLTYRPFHDRLRELVEEQLVETIGEYRRMLAEYAAWPVEDDEFRRSYALRHRVAHLVGAERLDEAARTVKDLEYLTAKACAEGVVAIERDIWLAGEARQDDETRQSLTILGRLVAASTHWAREVPQALPALLHDRALTNEPELLGGLGGLARLSAKHPRLRHPLQVRVREMPRILQGHTKGVTALAVLAHNRVISGSLDGTLRVWDVATGRTLATLHGHTDGVTALAALTDGRVVSGSLDGTLRVWDVATGRTLTTLHGHTGVVRAVAVLPDGRLVSGSKDLTLRVWDAESGQNLATDYAHGSGVTALTVLPDGCVVSASEGNSLRMWDVATGRIFYIHGPHEQMVTALAVLPDGRLVAGSSILWVWNVATGRTFANHDPPEKFVTALTVLPDGRLVSGSVYNTLRVWDVATGRISATLHGHTNRVRALAVLPDGRFVSGSDDRTLRVWNVQGATLTRVHGHEDYPSWVSASMVLSGGRFVSVSDDKPPQVLDIARRRALHDHNDRPSYVCALVVLPKGRIISSSPDGPSRVWDVASGRSIDIRHGHTSAFAILPDGRIVSGSGDKELRVWDVLTGRGTSAIHDHRSRANALAVLPDGRVASASDDNTLQVCNVLTGLDYTTLRGHTGGVRALAVLPNGCLVSGSDDTTLRVWDVATERTLAVLYGHTDKVTALAALPDGRLASGSFDNTLRVWDVQTGRDVATLHGHTNWVMALAVLPDGRLVSGSFDNTLRVWDVSTGRMLTAVYGDAAFLCVACADQHLIVAGDAAGNVWFIDLPPSAGEPNSGSALPEGSEASSPIEKTPEVRRLEAAGDSKTGEPESERASTSMRQPLRYRVASWVRRLLPQ